MEKQPEVQVMTESTTYRLATWVAWIGSAVIGAMVVIALLTMAGCVSVSYDPQTGAFKYYRLGSQEIQGFEAGSGDTHVKFEAQRSDASALVEAATRGAAQGLVGGVTP